MFPPQARRTPTLLADDGETGLRPARWKGCGGSRIRHCADVLAAFAVIGLIDRGAVVKADAIFKVTTLGDDSGYATSVNASGQVTGLSVVGQSSAHATLTGSDGVGRDDLGTLSGSGVSLAQAVNDAGQVVGFSTTNGGFVHAFVTGPDGSSMRDLGTLSGGTISFGFAVNNAGQVAGYSMLTVAGAVQSHAFLSGPGGMTDLGTLGTGTSSAGYAINASGQVAGYSYLSGASGYYHAFLTINGAMKDLGTLSGDVSSVGQALNGSGQVAGVSYNANGTYRAFLSDASGGALHDLGALTPGGSSYAYGVNDRGQVVGYATTASGQTDAFVTNNGKIFDLNSLIPDLPGVHLSDAMAITDDGMIVAIGIDANGLARSYLLDLTGTFPNGTAVPSPSGLLSLVVGLGGLALRRRRRTRALS